MKAYMARFNDPVIEQKMEDAGVGECAYVGSLPPQRMPWIYDNCFHRRSDWVLDIQVFFEEIRGIGKYVAEGGIPPDFIVIPLAVVKSFMRAKEIPEWLEAVTAEKVDLYMSVYPGMMPDDVSAMLEYGFAGLHLGEEDDRYYSVGMWQRFCRSRSLGLHVDGVIWPDGVKYLSGYADSISGSLPQWALENIEMYLRAVQKWAG